MGKNFKEILLDEMGQHESVVQHWTPADEIALERRLPECANERADKQHLEEAHAHVWRHFEGSQFEQAQSKAKPFWRKQFVHAELGAMRVSCYVSEQVSKKSVDSLRRATRRGQMAKSKLEFVQGVHARFIHTRILTGRANVHS